MTESHLLFHTKVRLQDSPLGLPTVMPEHEAAIVKARGILEAAGLTLDRSDHPAAEQPVVRVRAPRKMRGNGAAPANAETEANKLAEALALTP